MLLALGLILSAVNISFTVYYYNKIEDHSGYVSEYKLPFVANALVGGFGLGIHLPILFKVLGA